MALTKLNTHGIGVDVILAEDIAANAVTVSEIQDNAVTLAKLSATGTASATTFLRGDYSWVTVGGAYSDWDLLTDTPTDLVAKGQYICKDTTARTHTLPAGSEGDTVIISNVGTATVTIARTSNQKINSVAADGTLAQGNSTQLVYVDGTTGWFEV